MIVMDTKYMPDTPENDGRPNERPVRKRNRLDAELYRTAGAFFITICTDERTPLFWTSASFPRGGAPELSGFGRIAEECLQQIAVRYTGSVTVPKYVVMPDHVHMILSVVPENGLPLPDVRQIVRMYKGMVTHRIGKPLWQKGFYDHIIRDETEYHMIWKYIDDNPLKRMDDAQ